MPEQDSSVSIPPATGAQAEVNAEWVSVYDAGGLEYRVRREDLGDAERRGHSLVRYDLDSAYAEWAANHEARAETVRQSIAEFRRSGLIRDEVYDALNQAVGQELDAYRALMAAVGATVPHESHIAALAEHLAQHGELPPAQFPFEQRNLPAAQALAPDRVAYWRDRSAADDAQRDTNIRAGIAAGLVEAPEGYQP